VVKYYPGSNFGTGKADGNQGGGAGGQNSLKNSLTKGNKFVIILSEIIKRTGVMKKKLMLATAILLLGLGGTSLSTPGPDQNDYYEAEPWDDIYNQNKDGSTNPDTSAIVLPDRGTSHSPQSLFLNKSAKKGQVRRGKLASLWSQIRYFIISLWR